MDPLVRLRRFFAELRRRRVFRVAAAYAIVGWIVTEAASVLVPALLLPAWLTRAVVLLVLLGFPIALVLAWAYDITPEGVRRTDASPRTGPIETAGKLEPTASRHARVGPAVLVVLGILLAAAAFLLVRGRMEQADERRARALLPEIERRADQGRYRAAYRLAVEADESLQDDTLLAELWPRISDRLTVGTEPPGARVLARHLSSESARESIASEPELLGATPLEELRLPRGPHLLRLEKEGFAPVERLASSELARAEGSLSTGDETNAIVITVELLSAGEALDRMVFVPGGTYELVTPDLPAGLEAPLDDYFIDRYEVSNARFREFVAAGGYGMRTYWPSRIVDEGDTLGFEAAIDRLTDRTGLPAPRGWTGQEYPDGRGDHPVTGVTWYEASAYCAFRGKRLPTVFQWEKAARDGRITHHEGVVMPWGYVSPGEPSRGHANFVGAGTVPVDAHPFGISPYGAYAMAGNAKEWTANPIGARRTVTGGSWEEPMYVFSEFGAFDPFFASGSLGFRCARVRAEDARRLRDQGSFALEIDERTPSYDPVDEATFRSLLAHYRYDPRPLEPEVLDSVETPDWTRVRLSYAGPAEERVLAYLWLPKSAPEPYQTLVFVPGAHVFFGDSVPNDTEHWLGPIVRSGRAVFTVVLKGMVEREWGRGYKVPETHSVRFRDEMVRHATELRLGLDYLESRDDITMDRLAYVGLSFGAGSRLGFAAVDDRYDAVIFIGGGIDERVKPTLPEADNVNFAPYIRPPKLLLNGRHDEEHPWFTRALPLWNMMREPKELVLAEGAGHIPPPEVRIPAINTFLDTIFGPVPGPGAR